MLEPDNGNAVFPVRFVLICLFILLWLPGAQAQESQEIELSAEERAWIAANPVFQVGAFQLDPYILEENGRATGYIVEVLQTIARQVGLEPEFHFASVQEVLEQLRQGRIAAAMALLHTEEREKFLFLSQESYTASLHIFAREGVNDITGLDSLSGKTLASSEGYGYNSLFTKYLPDTRILTAPDVEGMFRLVASGQADALVFGPHTGRSLLRRFVIHNVESKAVAVFADEDTYQAHYYGIGKHLPLLASVLDKSHRLLPSVEKQRIWDRWFTTDESLADEFVLSPEEQAYLASMDFRRTRCYGWLPFSFRDREGEIVGLTEDYWALIRDKLGLQETKGSPVFFAEALEAMQQGKVDICPGTSYIEDRTADAVFSESYEHFPIAIATRRDGRFISSASVLEGQVVAVGENYTSYHLLNARYPAIEFLWVKDTKEALKRVADGMAFAAVDILPALQYLIEDFGSEDVKLAGVTEVPFPLQVMVSKEHAGLLPLINRAIVSISPEERAAIHRKWMVRDVISSPDYAWLWLVLAAVLLPMAFILFWNRRMAREIVRRQQVESALNESRDQLTRVLQAGNLGFWDWRPLSDELFTNDIFLTMLGHEVDAFPQTTERWATLVHPDDLEPTLGILQAFIDGEDGDYRSEHRMRTADGQWKWILDVGRVIERNAEGKAERFVGVHIDINERKQMEQELKGAIATAEEMTQEAERATQVKSAFLANMSHEIRTPMNAIIGMSELSLEGSLAPRERNFVTKVHQSAKSLLGIINSILDFSKIEADKLELEIVDFPLQAVLDNLNNLIGYRAEEQGLALNIEIDPQVPPVLRGDPLRLGQILINLGNNAVKFTQQGEITVKVNLDEQNGEHVVLHFGVCDTGIGMTQEQQQRVFQSFDQADSSISRQYGGTGLGLAISKNLVQIMGGTIWAESEMGRGSNFHFVLPLEIGDTGLLQQQAEDEVEQVAQLRGAKVLLVEDNEFNQELAAELLANKGMFVTTAWNGREALEVLQTEQFDIVLMDLQMPVMGGYEATREIRKQARLKELPVIALTANVMAGERDKAKSAGMNDLIGKPLDVSEMFATMVRWIKMDHLSKQQTGLKIDPEKDREKDGTALIGDSSGEFDVLVGINIEKGLAVTDNDSQLYRRILMMFFDEHREFAKEFRFAQQDGDPQAAARAAHTLKGVAASIGATAVRQAADGLEHVCLQNGTDEIIDSALQQVIGELDPVMAGLARFVCNPAEPGPVCNPAEPGPRGNGAP